MYSFTTTTSPAPNIDWIIGKVVAVVVEFVTSNLITTFALPPPRKTCQDFVS